LRSNVTWLELSTTNGTISTDKPEQRVFVSVDWSKLTGVGYASITITAKATGQPSSSQSVIVVADHTVVPSGFKGTGFWLVSLGEMFKAHVVCGVGFVEGDGAVSIEAAHASRNTSVGGITWSELPGYGRTVSGITPWPRGGDEANFTAGTGPSV
jgi:hypothetical protein